MTPDVGTAPPVRRTLRTGHAFPPNEWASLRNDKGLRRVRDRTPGGLISEEVRLSGPWPGTRQRAGCLRREHSHGRGQSRASSTAFGNGRIGPGTGAGATAGKRWANEYRMISGSHYADSLVKKDDSVVSGAGTDCSPPGSTPSPPWSEGRLRHSKATTQSALTT